MNDLTSRASRPGHHYGTRLCSAEKALAAVIQETYIQGASTRSFDELVKAENHETVRQQASREPL
jgi:transposase-like protein